MYIGQKIFEFYYYFFTAYSLSIFLLYFTVMIISIFDLRYYFRKNSFINYTSITSSPFAPSISVLVPLFNEEKSIITTIQSLLSNYYVNFNIIIINDGSSDKSLEKLISYFNLKTTNFLINEKIKTKTIKNVYKSSNKSYEKLILIDKVNGGKADALNAGLNVSENDYILSIDADCVISNNALQKMIKPFLDKTKHKVIATGSVIRIINDCVVKNGKLMQVNISKRLIVKFQILEYLRSFLLARVAWSKYRGLMCISGAFGMYEREKMLLVKGYNINTLGEDMDIMVKIQRYMYDNNQEFEIAYIPDPVCWTEVPHNYKDLYYQRKRWARGTIKTIKDHRKVMIKPKYGVLGYISYPAWLIYERFGPIIEIIGILYFLFASILGYVNWIYTISFLIATYLFAILYNSIAVFSEELTYRQYKKRGDFKKLFFALLIEPFIYHVFLLYPALVANFEELFSVEKKWGKLKRIGIGVKKG